MPLITTGRRRSSVGLSPLTKSTRFKPAATLRATPLESAIIADLPAGNYTAIVRGVNNLTGVALVEVYDLSPETSSILGDISTRGYVQTGDNVMIGGFTIPGTQPKGVILRAIGPELSKYGIPNPLADPTLELYDSTGALIASNDNWQHTAIGGIIAADQVRDILNSGLAPGDQNESVINATLVPGNYTAIVRGVNNTTGVALLAGHRTSPTYTWTGAVDSHWENPANWKPNGVPERGDSAAIPSGTSNSPTISDQAHQRRTNHAWEPRRRLSYSGRRSQLTSPKGA